LPKFETSEHGRGEDVGREEAQIILAEILSLALLSRLPAVRTVVVYTELMDFDGDEIYFQDEPTLVGRPSAMRFHLTRAPQ